MPTMPSRLPPSRRPSIEVGPQPLQPPPRISRSPSASRRETARISAIVMSAVSSVSTPGVLVTTMPRCCAAAKSTWSMPAPNEAISFSDGEAAASTSASIRSVTVGTSTSAAPTAAISSALLNGLSFRLSRQAKSSIIRVSTGSGSLRVTMTIGRFDRMTAISAEDACRD
jgi:hypothetical protein